MKVTVRVFNVEADFPTVDEARRLVAEEIRRAKREGVGRGRVVALGEEAREPERVATQSGID